MILSDEVITHFTNKLNMIRKIPMTLISFDKRVAMMHRLQNEIFSEISTDEVDFFLKRCRFLHQKLVQFFKNNVKANYGFIPLTSHIRTKKNFKDIHKNEAKLTLKELEFEYYYLYLNITAEINILAYPQLKYDFTNPLSRNMLILTCLDGHCVEFLAKRGNVGE